mmetsp:Transcript_4817/g.8326  ORF Transcript_4817/g.8326 Transcript_4817/m.8326 type:complete len:127 (+) Transcript_4817:6-386(+)
MGVLQLPTTPARGRMSHPATGEGGENVLWCQKPVYELLKDRRFPPLQSCFIDNMDDRRPSMKHRSSRSCPCFMHHPEGPEAGQAGGSDARDEQQAAMSASSSMVDQVRQKKLTTLQCYGVRTGSAL